MPYVPESGSSGLLNAIWTLIHGKEQQYGVPQWIGDPLIMAESGADPSAQNAGHYGLLQLSPQYPGASGYSTSALLDAATNLDIGLPPIAKAYQAENSPATPSLGAYDTALTTSGHDLWTGQFSSKASQANFESTYTDYMQHEGSGNVSTGLPNSGVGNPLDALTSLPGNLVNGGFQLGRAVLPVALLVLGIVGVGAALLLELRSHAVGA